MARNDDRAAEAILAKDTDRRLDAIIRRHGGEVRPSGPRFRLPTPGRRHCAGQLDLFDELDDTAKDDAP